MPGPHASGRTRSVWIVGNFPPPVHGMSAITRFVHGRLSERGIVPMTVDFSPGSLTTNVAVRLWNVGRILIGAVRFGIAVAMRRVGNVYVGAAGGWGQWYDSIFLFAARCGGSQIHVHHHSYAYLNATALRTRVMVRSAGPDAWHIVACPLMENDLRRFYPGVKRVKVISGVVALPPAAATYTLRSEVGTIGFISNISVEKGILEFLAVIRQLTREHVAVKAKVAGPFETDDIRGVFLGEIATMPNVEYVGPRYGLDKERFFDAIDVVLFPTRYRNESEGLVIHEAMSRAVPVIAYGRGCIREIIDESCGRVVDAGDDFLPPAVEAIRAWRASSEQMLRVSRAARERFEELSRSHAAALADLMVALAEGAPQGPPDTVSS